MIKERTLGEMLDGSWQLLRQHKGLLLGVALVYDGIPFVLGNVYIPIDQTAEPAVLGPQLLSLAAWSGFTGLLAIYATAWCAFRIATDRVPRLWEALSSPWRAPSGVFACFVVHTILLAVGYVPFLIPGLLIAVFLMPLGAVLAVEAKGTGEAFARAMELGFGHWRRAALIALATFLAMRLGEVLVQPLIEVSFGMALLAHTPFVVAIGAITNVVIFFFYVDLRVRKEGFDLDHLAAQLAALEDEEEGPEPPLPKD